MSELDEESIEFLRAVRQLGGRARSDEIRIETGLSADQRDRRFDKLEDRGYILVSRADEPLNGGGYPPRFAQLSDKGKRFIRNLDDDEDDTGGDTVTVSRTQFEDFSEQLERLENRVNTLTQTALSNGEPAGDRGHGPCSLAEENEEDLGEVWRVLDEPIRNRLNRLELQMQATQHLFGVQGLDFDAAVEDVRDDE